MEYLNRVRAQMNNLQRLIIKSRPYSYSRRSRKTCGEDCQELQKNKKELQGEIEKIEQKIEEKEQKIDRINKKILENEEKINLLVSE